MVKPIRTRLDADLVVKALDHAWGQRGRLERLFRSLKSEWTPALGYRNLPEAQRDVGDYLMGYYNQQRPHTFNGGVSPVVAEEKLKILSSIS
ncbi:MAG: putative transposase [Halopseudomonas sp.]|jgi:putative transposase